LEAAYERKRKDDKKRRSFISDFEDDRYIWIP
jgi:hypothetical protein